MAGGFLHFRRGGKKLLKNIKKCLMIFWRFYDTMSQKKMKIRRLDGGFMIGGIIYV